MAQKLQRRKLFVSGHGHRYLRRYSRTFGKHLREAQKAHKNKPGNLNAFAKDALQATAHPRLKNGWRASAPVFLCWYCKRKLKMDFQRLVFGDEQWRNEVGTRGDICRRAQHFGGAKLSSECYVLITKYQMSAVANNYNLQNVKRHCEISSRSSRFAKRAVMNVVTFQGGVSVASSKRPLVVWPTAASQRFQKTRVANFSTSLSFYSCVTMGRKSSFHSACRVLYCACF